MQVLLRWLHLVGVAFWAGGMFVNILVLMPSMEVLSPPERGKMMGAFLKRFAPLAWGALALVGVTGLILTNNIIGLSALVSFDTRYSNVMLTKIILVAVITLNGVYLSFVLGPRVASFAPPPGAPKPAAEGDRPPGRPPELLRLQKRMATLMWVQVGLALVVLLLMAL